MSTRGLVIAGTRSGCGKTTSCLALAAALVRRGLVVQACKIGPDFIDPAHHHALTGRPSYNLDTWMNGQQGMRQNFKRALQAAPQPDLLLVEGVMGLYDGAHREKGNASSAESALLLDLPVLLLLDTHGMAQSVAALARGYLTHMPELRFAGLACTQVGGPAHEEMLREALRPLEQAGVPLLGCLPRSNAPQLPSRHLGLVLPHDAPHSAASQAYMADWLEEHFALDALLQSLAPLDLHSFAEAAPSVSKAPEGPKFARTLTLLIAQDAAFCFLYPELPEMLQEHGINCVYFSPLENAGLPEGDALYLPGGYPELFAENLARNTSMREAIRSFARSGRPVYAECGGYTYLMEEMEYAGKIYPLCGCLPLRAALESGRAALGYRQVRPATNSILAPLGAADPNRGRGHEFHYARLTHKPELPALWLLSDRQGRACGKEGVSLGNIAASWVHLAPHGAWPFWLKLLQTAAQGAKP